nr:hypothetical protein [Tanacetum cinerariifolium]
MISKDTLIDFYQIVLWIFMDISQRPTNYCFLRSYKVVKVSKNKVDSEPPHGSNADITNPHEFIQTLDISTGDSELIKKTATMSVDNTSGLGHQRKMTSNIVSLVPTAAAPRPDDPTGSPSSTSIDQAAPSTSTSSKIQETQSLVIFKGKVFTEVGDKWKPTRKLFSLVGNSCPLTMITSTKVVPLKETTTHLVETQKLEIKVYNMRSKLVKSVGSSKKSKIIESRIANNLELNHYGGSNATNDPTSSSLVNDRLSISFSGSLSSTTIDLDAPSTSSSSPNQQQQSSIISQGVEELIPNTHFDDPCYEPLHDAFTSKESSSNVHIRQTFSMRKIQLLVSGNGKKFGRGRGRVMVGLFEPKVYLEFALEKVIKRKARKFRKPASPSKKKALIAVEEPTKKAVKKPATKRQSAGVHIRDTPIVFVSKKKAPAKAERSKRIELLSEVALLEETQWKKRLSKEANEKQTFVNQVAQLRELTVYEEEDEFVHTLNDYVPTDDENVDDEEFERINEEMYSDVNVELKDIEREGKEKNDEEMTDICRVEAEHENVNQEVVEATTLNAVVLDPETLFAIHLGVSYLEKEVIELKNVYHSSALRAIIKFEVSTTLKGYIGTSLDDALCKLKKRKPDDTDRDEDPPARLNQGLKTKKTSKDVEHLKKAKSTKSSKGTTKSQQQNQGEDKTHQPQSLGHCAPGCCIMYLYKTYCNPKESGRSSTWCRELPKEAQHI